MDKRDEYILKIYSDGTRFYYKNKQLHREAGPAVINSKDVAKFSNLGDEGLYEEVHEKTPKKEGKMTTIHTENGPIFSYEAPIEHTYTTRYYLNNIPYLENEFHAILLEKELSKNENQSKKLKL